MKTLLCLTALLFAGYNYAQISNQEHTISLPDNNVYDITSVEVPPEFEGGNEAFQKFLLNNFKTENLAPGAAGAKIDISLSFIVEKDGVLTGIKTLNDPGFDSEKEIKRVLNRLKTGWLYGIKDNKPVRTRYNTTITISIPSKAGTQPEISVLPMAPNFPATTGESEKSDFTDTIIYTVSMLETIPQFPGGTEMFFKFINKNIKRENLKAAGAGKGIKILLQFVIEKDGFVTNAKMTDCNVTDAKFTDTINYDAIDKEVLRVLNLLKTKWKPGISNGKSVRVLYRTHVIITP